MDHQHDAAEAEGMIAREPAEAPKAAPSPSVEDKAAYDYMMLIPLFEKKIEELSNRQLKRVVLALMKHPFEGMDFHLPYQQEKELYYLGQTIFDCKFVLMRAVLAMHKSRIQEIISDGTSEETKE